MPLPFWNLPGPRNFLSRIMEDLQLGRSCLVSTPRNLPLGIRTAMRASVVSNEGLACEALSFSEDARCEPIETLFQHFAPDTASDALQTIGGLLGMHDFTGRVIWIDNINEKE